MPLLFDTFAASASWLIFACEARRHGPSVDRRHSRGGVEIEAAALTTP
jgi:hypothetical protein